MSIKRTIITTVVALAVVAMVAPVNVGAVTVDELLVQIAQLQQQLQALQGTTGGNTGAGLSACVGVTFSRNLTTGSSGSDVKCLQQVLNQLGHTVSATGAGSPGHETTYFGPATLRAVKKYQAAQGFTPANQVGPMTRAALNAYLGGNNPVNPPVITPTGAGLTVQLASDNPASGTFVSGTAATDGQGGADLAHFTFVNGDSTAVNVTQLKFNRTGVSVDELLDNVYLYQGANRITDGATVCSGVITFNGSPLFTVPAGGTYTIRVVADILYGKSGETVAVSIPAAANITATASSVKGNFPVTSNLMTTASATMATANFAAATSTLPYTSGSTATTVDPQNSYPVWSQTVTIGTRAVKLTRFALYQTGSAPVTAIQNYRLYVDGTQVGSAVNQPDANGYITFDLSGNPLTLQTGGRAIKVLADIIAGSSLTFSYSLRNSTDASFIDSQLNVGVTPQVNSASFSQLRSCNYNTSSYGCTINSGAITFVKATDSPSGNIIYQAPNAVLAKYTLTAAGEPVKITELYAGVTDSTTSGVTYLANGALYANGVQIGSTANLKEETYASSTSGNKYSLGSALIVTPGTPVTLELRADIKEASGTTAIVSGDTLQAWISAGSSNATGQVSKNSISTPSAQTTGNSLKVTTGTLSVSKYGSYTSQTVVAPLTQYKLAHFTVTGSTTEATNLNTIYIDLTTNTTPITNLFVKYGDATGTLQATTPIVTPSATAGGNSWAINYSLPAGKTIDLQVFADINSYFDTSVVTYAMVAGTTSSSTQTVYGSYNSASTDVTGGTANYKIAGQTISAGTGVLTGTQDPSTPVNQVVAGGQPVTAGIFKFTAQNDSYTINELKFSIGTATSAGAANAANAITSVALKDGTTTLASVPVQYLLPITGGTLQYVANFTGLTVSVPQNTVKSLSVVPTLASTLSSDSATTNVDVEPYLSYVKALKSDGTQVCNPVQTDCATATSTLIGTATVNKTYAFRAIPSIAYAGTDSHATAGSQVELYKTTVTANGGPIAIKQLRFNVTVNNTSGNNPGLYNFVLYKNGVALGNGVTTSAGVYITNSATSGSLAAGTDLMALTSSTTMGTGTVVVEFVTEDSVTSSATYQLKANVNSNFTAATSTKGADSVTTYIAYDAGNAHTTYNASGLGGSYIQEVGTAAATGLYQVGFSATKAGTAGLCTTSGCNFVWSDMSAATPTMHDYNSTPGTGTSSADWYNSYLILTGNTTTETVVAQ